MKILFDHIILFLHFFIKNFSTWISFDQEIIYQKKYQKKFLDEIFYQNVLID